MGCNERYSEVVIIGAGIAGLAAAKTLQKCNISFRIIEASHRIGGRAYSEKLSKNNWFDLGCSYLHNGDVNPFVSIADKVNFPIEKNNGTLFDSDKTNYFVDGKREYLGFPNPLDQAHNNIIKTIKKSKIDKTLLDSMNFKDPYFPISCHLATNLNAADPDLISSKDYKASIYDGPDYPVPKGFGNLIEKWGKNVEVNLNTKVREINWEKQPIKIKTSRGAFITKKIILTVSTGVLSGGDIKIIPNLPPETLTAINNLPMGTLNKIGISFKKRLFSQKDQGWYISWPSSDNIQDNQIGSFQVTASIPQSVIVFVGGRFGRWLEYRGSNVMLDYAISSIESVFGKSCTRQIENSITTAWTSEPLTKGAYSYAIPGQSYSRTILSNTIENKIQIAGEATEINHYGTAHGAYFSGKKAAKKIITQL